MKLHLFILSALLLNVLAHPVPDEEVSPVKPVTVAEIKSEISQEIVKKPLEEVKPEVKAAEESKLEKSSTEKLALPESAPDAEIALVLPEKKEEKASLEKQGRLDNNISGGINAVPVVETAAAGVETEKQIVDELNPAVPVPAGKNANIAIETPVAKTPVSEQKKDELSAVETAPSVKSEIPIAAQSENVEAPVAAVSAAVEEKKEEQAARQERGTEEKVKPVLAEEAVKSVVDATAKVTPDLKTLEAQSVPAKAEEISAPVVEQAELKTVEVVKPAESAPAALAAGDIPTQQPTQESIAKALPVEAEKVAESTSPVVVPVSKQIEENPIEKPEEIKLEAPVTDLVAKPLTESADPLKKLEEKPAVIEDKKSEESKESKESSSDSKESEESKEDKSN